MLAACIVARNQQVPPHSKRWMKRHHFWPAARERAAPAGRSRAVLWPNQMLNRRSIVEYGSEVLSKLKLTYLFGQLREHVLQRKEEAALREAVPVPLGLQRRRVKILQQASLRAS